MKNTNRYKLVPVLIIGLVLSTFSTMAEVKTIMGKGIITIKEGEVGKCVLLTMDSKGIFDTVNLTIEKDGTSVRFLISNALNVLKHIQTSRSLDQQLLECREAGYYPWKLRPTKNIDHFYKTET